MRLLLICLIIGIATSANAQTSKMDETLNSIIKKAKSFNPDFDKEMKQFIKKLDKISDKGVELPLGSGMTLEVKGDLQPELRISLYGNLVLAKTYLKHRDLINFLMSMIE